MLLVNPMVSWLRVRAQLCVAKQNVELLTIGSLVVNNAVADFHPCVTEEWRRPIANRNVGRESALPENPCGNKGALETQHALWIKRCSPIDCIQRDSIAALPAMTGARARRLQPRPGTRESARSHCQVVPEQLEPRPYDEQSEREPSVVHRAGSAAIRSRERVSDCRKREISSAARLTLMPNSFESSRASASASLPCAIPDQIRAPVRLERNNVPAVRENKTTPFSSKAAWTPGETWNEWAAVWSPSAAGQLLFSVRNRNIHLPFDAPRRTNEG